MESEESKKHEFLAVPQDHAKDLAEKIWKMCVAACPQGCANEHGHGLEFDRDKVAKLIAAHTASQLAGAVPQGELREVIERWRKMKGMDTYSGYEEGCRDQGLNCADELESLIERRGK